MNFKEKILRLKQKKDAIILAHYYQNGDIQDIADYVGDSYYLSEIGRNCTEKNIIFCGVRFMAESAKILSPNKKVFLPNLNASCYMVSMANAKDIEELKIKYPNAKVVCYINSATEVKAVSDVCCTSSSAINIVKKLDSSEIIFVPDKNLGSYIQEQIPDKKIILWDGCCVIHDMINAQDIIEAKNKYGQDIKVLSHPECKKEVRDLSDFIGSTGDILKFASHNNLKKYLIVTEDGILHKLKQKNPDKEFYTLNMICKNMKLTTLKDLYLCLENLENEITLDENIRKSAYRALENMHILGR
ncbi:quinolinate synthase NadA [Clostridium brassicae]|uniref:Quinolinate synthase n=1 Tax=Clostridium brassicae TaxID=2999072 RepID=A0ABT4D4R5_9CLOT|nr:quinolinate synthase NadA [Clostridium brassicae]MCY6957267.1 quinolinate synthase NadA [Clostridium brassicae]